MKVIVSLGEGSSTLFDALDKIPQRERAGRLRSLALLGFVAEQAALTGHGVPSIKTDVLTAPVSRTDTGSPFAAMKSDLARLDEGWES